MVNGAQAFVSWQLWVDPVKQTLPYWKRVWDLSLPQLAYT